MAPVVIEPLSCMGLGSLWDLGSRDEEFIGFRVQGSHGERFYKGPIAVG